MRSPYQGRSIGATIRRLREFRCAQEKGSSRGVKPGRKKTRFSLIRDEINKPEEKAREEARLWGFEGASRVSGSGGLYGEKVLAVDVSIIINSGILKRGFSRGLQVQRLRWGGMKETIGCQRQEIGAGHSLA